MQNQMVNQDSDELVQAKERLAQSIEKHIHSKNELFTGIPGLKLSRWENTTEPTSYTHKSSLCMIAQGSKRVLLGEETYYYNKNSFLISSVDLPVVANIVEASPDKPYLGIIMELDLQEISQLIIDSGLSFSHSRQASSGMAVSDVSLSLVNSFQRLLDLLDEPENIKVIAPLIKREIFFRLLQTNQGERLQQMVTAGSHSHQISKAIDWLKHNFSEPLSVTELASNSGMSKSAFHNHFRSLTSMTPLQYQKRLRLNEARRLMLNENLDALASAFKVGYESASQFSREYSRMFGLPPARDIKNLRMSEMA